eukprot:GHVU01069358.1.p1 GENE.GHVU01069358.1~~GHVU01069358.1.p1  ORF type:complete len:137 (-),score=9.34 GHVU01069358.1:558-968(-)
MVRALSTRPLTHSTASLPLPSRTPLTHSLPSLSSSPVYGSTLWLMRESMLSRYGNGNQPATHDGSLRIDDSQSVQSLSDSRRRTDCGGTDSRERVADPRAVPTLEAGRRRERLSVRVSVRVSEPARERGGAALKKL